MSASIKSLKSSAPPGAACAPHSPTTEMEIKMPDLIKHETAEFLRPATREEYERSRREACHHGGVGAINVPGYGTCYVTSEDDQYDWTDDEEDGE